MTPLQIGNAAGVLMLIVFSGIWVLFVQKRDRKTMAGCWMDAVGFGVLPAIAVWKAFEYAFSEPAGKTIGGSWEGSVYGIFGNGQFFPSGIEMIAVAAAFLAVVGWMMIRKEGLPGRGELLTVVICVWGLIRIVAEGFRRDAFQAGNVSLGICAALGAEIICFFVWSVRRHRKQKSPGLTAIEWGAVISCGALIFLQNAGIIILRNDMANIAASAGLTLLMGALILGAGRDNREADGNQ